MEHHQLLSRRSDDALLAAYVAHPNSTNLEALAERYEPLARSLARRYNGGSEPFEDLIQVAELGLVKAIRGYDSGRDTPFTAYAVPTIVGELRRHFRDRVWNLRLPRSLQESTITIDRALAELTEELGRDPDLGELAERSGLSEEMTREGLVAREARWTKSIDAPMRAGDPTSPTQLDLVSDEDPGYERVESALASTTAHLETREREVLRLRFGAGLTQREIGDRLGVSQMQVSRVSRRALAKLLGAVQGKDGPVALSA